MTGRRRTRQPAGQEQETWNGSLVNDSSYSIEKYPRDLNNEFS